jgi:gliding motility-associated-like protein
MKMKTLFLIPFLLFNSFFFSQLTVSNTLTPQQLVENVLAGLGVVISNVTYTGSTNAIGSFNGAASNIGFSGGVILSTGNITTAIGPNNSGGEGDNLGEPSDADIDDIVSPNGSFDASVLEFDFVPISDTVVFNYVFASEEYMEWVNSGVNDAFGFFISGPGINGPFSNNSTNIALIPGTTQFVTIDNVNANSNNQFYFNNESPVGQSVQYDGFTVPLQAISQVICGETYHLKIAIADAGDGIYDSGVFLEVGSLSSIGLNIDLSTVTGDTIIYENCTEAQFILSRPQSSINETITINYSMGGTAIEGVDYTDLPGFITFNPGDDTLIITFEAFQDGNLEGNETIIITATYTSACNDVITVTKSLIISEEPIFDATVNSPQVFCPSNEVPMTVQAIGGTPPYTYTWSNGETGSPANGSINGVGTETYIVDIVDFCGFNYQTSVTITQIDPPAIDLTLSAPSATCIEDSVLMTAVASGGSSPLVITWDNGGTGLNVFGLTTGNQTYTATATDDCNNTFSQTITIQDLPDPILTMNLVDVTIKCPSNQVPLSAIAGNGFPPYTYVWGDGQTGENIVGEISVNGTVDYVVTATDFCGNFISETLILTLDQTLNISSLNQTASVFCQPTGTTNSTVVGQTGTINYVWNGPGSLGGNVSSLGGASNLQTGWYFLNITDDVCFDRDSIFVNILNQVVASFTNSSTIGELPLNVIFTNTSQNADFYDWNFGNGTINNTASISNQNSNYTQIASYTVELIAYQGVCSDTAVISFEIISKPEVTPPNIFTPNGDNINDSFSLAQKNFKTFSFLVVNRWGNVMFEGDLTKPSWNGETNSGKMAEEGTYFYSFTGIGLNNDEINGQGYVQLTK